MPLPFPRQARALATDYDGTLARDGRLDDATVAALVRFRASGRRLILVTGRVLDELVAVCPRLDLFDRVVAENGALLYSPDDRSERLLAVPPPPSLLAALAERGVGPVATGKVIVATWRPHEGAVAAAIDALGLDLRVTLNKRAVMVLPSGVDKGSGLAVALGELGLGASGCVAVGDAENDQALFAAAGYAVAVANALPDVRRAADLVTRAAHGAGVAELIGLWLDADPEPGMSPGCDPAPVGLV